MTLEELGWDATWDAEFAPYLDKGWMPARIFVQHRKTYDVYADGRELVAAISGSLHHVKDDTDSLPAVGDWVAISHRAQDSLARIRAVLPRRSWFMRKAAGFHAEPQVIAANIDTIFLVSSLASPLNPRRIERFLALAHAGHIEPVILLNKADVCEDIATVDAAARAVAQNTEVRVVSARTGAGVEAILPSLQERRTIAFVGPSGVGKSTLVNALCGNEDQATAAVRDTDEKGRHTTTRRELIRVPSCGGWVLDTPGMREVALWDAEAGVAEAFDEIVQFAAGCRFRDCQHTGEPACAVEAAALRGDMPRERLDAYRKLQAEMKLLAESYVVRTRLETKRRDRVGSKAMRLAGKIKGRNRA